jgi:phage shock protein PspC (stress-responsive transcriptional regulator)
MNASDPNEETNDQVNDSPADSQPQAGSQPGYQSEYSYHPGDEPLYRPVHGRMLAGVAAGIAQYLGVDVNVVRIVLAVLTCFGAAGVPVYLAGWLLIPDEGASQSVASQLISSLQGRTN